MTGAANATGNLSCGGAKPFDIVSVLDSTKRMRHRCIESPKAINLYRYTLTCVAGTQTFPLPNYFEALNTAATVHASPADCFGAAFGSCSTDGSNTLTLVCNMAGTYNVTVYSDRNDKAAQDEFAEFGVEYTPPA